MSNSNIPRPFLLDDSGSMTLELAALRVDQNSPHEPMFTRKTCLSAEILLDDSNIQRKSRTRSVQDHTTDKKRVADALPYPKSQISELAIHGGQQRGQQRDQRAKDCAVQYSELGMTSNVGRCPKETMSTICTSGQGVDMSRNSRNIEPNDILDMTTPFNADNEFDIAEGVPVDSSVGTLPIALPGHVSMRVSSSSNQDAQAGTHRFASKPIRKKRYGLIAENCRKGRKMKNSIDIQIHCEILCVDGSNKSKWMIFRRDLGSHSCCIAQSAAESLGWIQGAHSKQCKLVFEGLENSSARCLGCFSTLIQCEYKKPFRVRFHVLRNGSLPDPIQVILGHSVCEKAGIIAEGLRLGRAMPAATWVSS